MDSLTLAFGIAGIAGAVISTFVAVRPDLMDWYYERQGRPLSVEVVNAHTCIDPAEYGLVAFRVTNRVRRSIRVSVAPMNLAPPEDINAFIPGASNDGVFGDPRVLIVPTNENAWSFWLPGKDTRELRLEYPVRPGLTQGAEDVSPVVVASTFRPQFVYLGPFRFVVGNPPSTRDM